MELYLPEFKVSIVLTIFTTFSLHSILNPMNPEMIHELCHLGEAVRLLHLELSTGAQVAQIFHTSDASVSCIFCHHSSLFPILCNSQYGPAEIHIRD